MPQREDVVQGLLREDEGKGWGPWDKVSRYYLKLAGQSQEQSLAWAQVATETNTDTRVSPVLNT